MSVEASIKIRYLAPEQKNLFAIEIIQIILSAGWTLNDESGCSYLSLGETEGFDWVIKEKIPSELLINILKEKERLNEPVGVVMTWQDTNIGGCFIFRRPQEFSVLLNINRKVIFNEGYKKITDASWYLSRLIPALDQHNIHIIYFAFEQLT